MKKFLLELFFSDELEKARQIGYKCGWEDAYPEGNSGEFSKEFYDAKLRTEGFWRGFGAGYDNCMKDNDGLKQRILDSVHLDEKDYKNKYNPVNSKVSSAVNSKPKSKAPFKKTTTKKMAPAAKKAIKK